MWDLRERQSFDKVHIDMNDIYSEIDEEENLQQIYKILKEYREVDDIPIKLLTSEISNKIDELLKLTKNCIFQEKNENG